MRKVLVILMLCALSLALFAAVQNTKPQVWRSSCVGCADCVVHCPVNAITVTDGKAVIDQQKCIDCKFCVTTCQYGAVR